MKKIFLGIITVLIATVSFSQSERSISQDEWLLSVGVNSVNSLGTKNPFEGIGDWGYRYPISVNIETQWDRLFSVDVGLTLNGFEEGSRLDAAGPPEDNLTYLGVDLSLKYYFGEFILPKEQWIDFYAMAGPGLFILDNTNISFNVGGGVVFWFGRAQKYGLKVQGLGKFALDHSNRGDDYANNHFQYNLQFVLRL
jgi:hypothetical protein